MGQSSNRPMSARAERRAILALLTVFALLVQAWIPSLAMAAPASAADMVLCTQQGLQTAPTNPDPGQTAPSHACQHCVCPALVSAPPPIVSVLAVAYVVAEAPVSDTPVGVRPQPRAPPRPPGQGPPSSDV